MSDTLKTSNSTVKRGPKRAQYDVATAHKIIDDTLICHVGQQMNDQVFVTPTCHWREGDYLYWHGHGKARNTHGASKTAAKVCINICELDGLVLARSAFHHTVNYRSVTLFGVPENIEDYDEKMRHFELFVNKVSPERWSQLRPVTDQEVNATSLVRIKIDEASVKLRAEGAIDDAEDMDWPVWAGVMPLEKHWQPVQQDSHQTETYPEPIPPKAF
ncbi:pyridoxamine 5'-phosphate oxidase family protein [Marinomonas atlantica]|uniref:pyridoxamine 5'-phosphate oxidase family protein n=1 Tax=Marinomonas atlantica TaxID=1806668 RepID=UPI0008321E6A|nr:pyridoxamine 5'-phosphate oxidase family protein [Marinomonas atlantica]MCO4786748.1 pyridoxamine 5'-phosphate oxidase family protein [Marinomonas atlantica]